MLKKVLKELIPESELSIKEEDIKYKSYWLNNSHCDESIPVIQVDRKIGWVCKHER